MESKAAVWQPHLYNDKHAFVYHYGESLIDLLAPQPGERVLDLGCGSGQLTAQLAERGCEVVGIDSSADMIADAQAKFPHLRFLVADAANFQLAPKFDAIFSNAVLHWVTDYQNAIRCLWENLRPGGRIVVEFGGKGNVQTIVDQLRKSLAARGYAQQAALQQWYFPSIGEYTPLLEQQGFRVTLAQHYDRPTELADEEKGIQDWLSMFGIGFFRGVSPEDQEAIKAEVQEAVKPLCFQNGKWYADYKRLRIQAVKA
ncbi:Trans-aconitate methyltransferase [Catalinimonas alkaloidigena]|uniref:Trans-aconitate methyltransferase n=1 Tax=Catalinimonas alkaloidigena TaxID=1075417 RepID=A0A1G9LUY4_9BACT|nr:methyltransferase domain-containing protein [Catalinimonas alkaloidigena]SDL65830.1 Trans-aconitate methyltransferase [Catalinimonas alkaloidigena]